MPQQQKGLPRLSAHLAGVSAELLDDLRGPVSLIRAHRFRNAYPVHQFLGRVGNLWADFRVSDLDDGHFETFRSSAEEDNAESDHARS